MVHQPQEGQGYHQEHLAMNPMLHPVAPSSEVQGRPDV